MGELGVFGLVAVMVPEAAWPAAREVVDALQLGAPLAEEDADDLAAGYPA